MTARRTVLSVLLAVAALGTPGAARTDELTDQPCTLVTTAIDKAVVTAGPVEGAGTLTCTVQVGAATHDGRDAASASATGTGVVVLEPREVSFADEWGDLYVCTTFTPTGGAPRYWSRGGWGADPAATCDRGFPGVREVLHLHNDWCNVDLCLWAAVDCRWLESLAPGVPGVIDVDHDGDVYVDGELLWDCPPYGS